jgi:hypothetical protein
MNQVARPRDYERTDADPALIGWLALGVAAFLIATPFALMALYPGADRLGGVPADLPLPPPPRLQTHPKGDLDRLRATEQTQLNTFGWVDRTRQKAHIPIEHAMELLTRRGLDGWPSSSPPRPATR